MVTWYSRSNRIAADRLPVKEGMDPQEKLVHRIQSVMCVAIAVLTSSFLPAQVQSAGVGPRASSAAIPDGLTSSEWSSIRAAYDAGRHAVSSVEGGYLAHNPGQRWTTRFDRRGFLTQPDQGGWTWGLELQSYGFAGSELKVEKPVRTSAAGGRVGYRWAANLEEWYKNDQRGLEHGYTVHARPADARRQGESRLTFTIAVRGTLLPAVADDGRGVRFLNDEGAVVLSYTGLTVFDADGHGLDASFERVGDQLRLCVDELDARYPLTIDPIAQQAYLKASNTEAWDHFGVSVAISGDTVVVGAYHEDSNATGVNGNQSDNSAYAAGAAYVFVRSGSSWSQQAYLKPSNTNANDLFGIAVAILGDTVVVGAHGEASNATGINGSQSDNSAKAAGAAYVFVRSGSNWSQQAYLKASNTNADDSFGCAVTMSGDTVVVGAHGEDSSAIGVNGNQSDNSAADAGAAYVFVRSGTSWSQQAYLKASNTNATDLFSLSVAISGDTVVVGANQEASNAIGVNGNQSNNSASYAGAAYVFVRSGTSWSQQAYLKASNTYGWSFFGRSVAISGSTVVVGAPREASNATGVNGNQSNLSVNSAGAAYVFVRTGSNWSQEAYLKASNTGAHDYFGTSVAISSDTVVVGAKREDSNATGVNGNQSDDSAVSAGAAYVFVRSGTKWSQQAYLKASNMDFGDYFGESAAISGDTVVVGAQWEQGNVTGVNGNQGDNSAHAAGAAYVFDLNIAGVTAYGTSSPGCTGPVAISVNSIPRVGNTGFAVTSNNTPPNAVGALIIGGARFRSPPLVLGTEILVSGSGPFFFVGSLRSNARGSAEFSMAIPAHPTIQGLQAFTQFVWIGPTAPAPCPPLGLSASDALHFTVQ